MGRILNKKKSLLIIIPLSFFLTNCFGLFDSGSDRVTGKYIVVWIDLLENQSLSEQFEMNSASSSDVVRPYVFAVGHNNDFIIAKQHPTDGFEGGYHIDTKITNYYIVDMNRKVITKGEKVFGPLTLNQFDSLRTVLKIKDIKFDMIYPDKP